MDGEHASLFDNELANSWKEFQRVLPHNFGDCFNVEFLDPGNVFTRQTDVAWLVTNLADETQDNGILYTTTRRHGNTFKTLVINYNKVRVIYIYNSVLTCRQHIINSSASTPPNATKIAVKKVSDVDVCMFGPEL